MCLLTRHESWYRRPEIYAFFDRLADQGFFDGFEQVLFYGAGAAAYAAAVFSVSAPGASVLLLYPQATLNPRVVPWENRFPAATRYSFTDRYGYAPDMVEAAGAVYVLYDPHEPLDAKHAQLFEKSSDLLLEVPYFGDQFEIDLQDMFLRDRLITKAASQSLTTDIFSQLLRKRRQHRPYLQRLLNAQPSARQTHIQSLQSRINALDAAQLVRKRRENSQHKFPNLRLVSG
ncbi:MAG: phosphoadenosine phosphosulfate reductase [Cognatishimia sp.]